MNTVQVPLLKVTTSRSLPEPQWNPSPIRIPLETPSPYNYVHEHAPATFIYTLALLHPAGHHPNA